MDTKDIVVIAAQVGGPMVGFAIIGKWLLKSAEKANESLPVILDNLRTMGKAIEDLFQSRNKHAEEIVAIKTGIDHCEHCNSYKHKRKND